MVVDLQLPMQSVPITGSVMEWSNFHLPFGYLCRQVLLIGYTLQWNLSEANIDSGIVDHHCLNVLFIIILLYFLHFMNKN
jgi:hypothetical protein